MDSSQQETESEITGGQAGLMEPWAFSIPGPMAMLERKLGPKKEDPKQGYHLWPLTSTRMNK